MDPVKILAMLERMEEFLARGIEIEVQPREPAPLVLIRVKNPEDSVLVPEITALALALALFAENQS